MESTTPAKDVVLSMFSMIFKKHGRVVLLVLGVMVATICTVIYILNGQIRYDAVFGRKPYSERVDIAGPGGCAEYQVPSIRNLFDADEALLQPPMLVVSRKNYSWHENFLFSK